MKKRSSLLSFFLFVLALGALLGIVLKHRVYIIDENVPLDSVNKQAAFYLITETGDVFHDEKCIYVGNGVVSSLAKINGYDISSDSFIVTEPDTSGLLQDNEVIEWQRVYSVGKKYRVIGKIVEIVNDASNVIADDSDGLVDAQKYGMIGDGITDNTAVFISLINTGKRIYLPAGNYLIHGPLTITDDVTIVGEPGGDSKLCVAGDVLPDKVNWYIRIESNNFSAENIIFELTNSGNEFNTHVSIGCSLVKVAKTNVSCFTNCKFISNEKSPYFVTSLWINSDNSQIGDVSFESCDFINTSNLGSSGAVWIYACNYPINSVVINNSYFYQTGSDENLAIWSNDNIPLRYLNISNCRLENNNSVVYSDNLLACYVKSPESTLEFVNNTFDAVGIVLTDIKLTETSNIIFTGNTINVISNVSTIESPGYLLKIDNPNVVFTNNNLKDYRDESARMRIMLSQFSQFANNKVDCSGKSFNLELNSDNLVRENENRLITNNIFKIDADIFDILMPIICEACNFEFGRMTKVFLPKQYSYMELSNSSIVGDIKVVFDESLNNTILMSKCDIMNTISSNVMERVIKEDELSGTVQEGSPID